MLEPAPSQQIQVDDKFGKLFRPGPPPVYLFDNGKFGAQVDGHWRLRSSVAALEKVIKTGLPVLRMMHLDTSEYYPRGGQKPIALDVVEMTPNSRRVTDADGKKHNIHWHDWFVYDETVAEALANLANELECFMETYNKKRRRLIGKLKEVRHSTFKEVLKKHGQRRQT